ncbi:hypothetical protein [Tateyamaria sp. ANG-S1]|uniref:hypothetical protein n=1 Tax=Tateyamaria sp. ANG-S1 TaxID=1577905 RepID=UPI00057C369C|nr:hypothetical protein [Tateyamaria sp. ANG-S1]KIC50837.1 hypothetical protein RA29_02685 [Tateyamaria sp. ANG-S1]
MDLQAIGIVLVSQTKEKRFDPADEEQYYQELAAGRHVAMMVEVVSAGFTLFLSVFARVSPKRLRTLWKPTPE